MIINFNQFIKEAVSKKHNNDEAKNSALALRSFYDWISELKSITEKMATSVISIDEIEDNFLEMIEDGISFNCELKSGRIVGHGVSGLSRKRDLSEYECYPFYRISLYKKVENKVGDDLLEMKRKLMIHCQILDKIRIAQNRLLHNMHNIEILNNISYIVSGCDLKVEFYLQIKDRISPLDDLPTKPSIFGRVKYIIENNKAFNIDEVSNTPNGMSILFSFDRKYNITKEIVESIFNKFGNGVELTVPSSKDNHSSDFRITILER